MDLFQERKCKSNIIQHRKDERIKPENVVALGSDEIPREFSGSRSSRVLERVRRKINIPTSQTYSVFNGRITALQQT